MDPQISLFIVDDEPDVRMLISLVVRTANHGLVVSGEADSGDAALAGSEMAGADVVILDQMMPGLSGIETAVRLRAEHPRIRTILCSAHLTDEVRALAAGAGIDLCLSKAQISRIPDEVRRLASAA